MAKRQEKVSFEMKAAEIIMDRHSPWAALDAVALLHRMYPRRLSETFVQQFDPALFHGTRLYEIRMKLFEALSKADTDDERERIFKIFESIFPEEEKREWFQNMRRAISSTPAQAAVIRH